MSALEQVFGVGVKLDANGKPIERGFGNLTARRAALAKAQTKVAVVVAAAAPAVVAEPAPVVAAVPTVEPAAVVPAPVAGPTPATVAAEVSTLEAQLNAAKVTATALETLITTK